MSNSVSGEISGFFAWSWNHIFWIASSSLDMRTCNFLPVICYAMFVCYYWEACYILKEKGEGMDLVKRVDMWGEEPERVE